MRFCILVLLTICNHLSAHVDLEKYTQDFVLETKRIDIPEFPHAFNPSIVRWNGRLLMSFRIVLDVNKDAVSSSSDSQIGLVWLDEEFNPCSTPQILQWVDEDIYPADGRLLSINGNLFLVYTCYSNKITLGNGFLVHVATVCYDGNEFYIPHNECLSHFEGLLKNKPEKNWVPYGYQDSLHLAYKLAPHKIFYPILDGSGICETIATTHPSIVWEWGELRGGTPALELDGRRYLAFFHSSITRATVHSSGKEVPHYFMGAYTFTRGHPFTICEVSPEPIVGTNFYHGEEYEPYWHSVRVVFPCGFIMDDESIWISYGRQDHECWIVKLDKQALLESLIQVSTYD